MSTPRELTVPPQAAGTRLDAWLAGALEETSRAAAAALVDAGAVLVDGQARAKGARLRGGERVTIAEGPVEPVDPAGPSPAVVWESEALWVIDKPPGLIVHPAPGHRAVTLVEWLGERFPGSEPHAVHRLDRDTSGLMLVAKGEAAQRELQAALRRREVVRGYLALVTGRLEARSGTIDAPLGRDVRRRTVMSTRTDRPREARTHFEVERFVGDHTLVRARLETGRTHQIRAHFAAIGHPVAGDRAYGARDDLRIGRQFLHSARLGLGGDEWRSELPADLDAALGRANPGSRGGR